MAEHRSWPRLRAALAVASSALATIVPQLLALLLLEPAAFGQYSMVYLVFAFASSAIMSLVAEARSRAGARTGVASDWQAYSEMLSLVAVPAGLMGGLASLVVTQGDVGLGAVSAVAVASWSYRTGARYFEVTEGDTTAAVRSDVAALLISLVVWAVGIAVVGATVQVALVSWAVGGVTGIAVMSLRPALMRRRTWRRWMAGQGSDAWSLFRESFIMDIGALGTPLAIAPVLGIGDFGIYRAVSNVAAPIRLILNPLRPNLAARNQSRPSRGWNVAPVLGAALVAGAGASAVLSMIWHYRVPAGTLLHLAQYPVPVGLYVAANLLGHFYYLIARLGGRSEDLLRQRVIQTVVAVAGPVSGALLGGLEAALWGLAIATVISAAGWTMAVPNLRAFGEGSDA